MAASHSEDWDNLDPFDTDSESEADSNDAASPDQMPRKPLEPEALPLGLYSINQKKKDSQYARLHAAPR